MVGNNIPVFFIQDAMNFPDLVHAVNSDYIQFINEGFRHCKAIAFAKGAEELIKETLVKEDQGVILESKKDLTNDFITAMKGHRVWEREKSRKVLA